MGARIVFGSLIRDRTNLFQSFVQPLLLAWILGAGLDARFSLAPASASCPRDFFLSFPASEFYAVVVLVVTVLIASQYATDLAVQCRGRSPALRPPLQYRSALRAGVSVAAGVVLLVTASTGFFLAASGFLLGVGWPLSSPTFFILLGGLVLLSISGGFALGLATDNRGLSDLLITVLVFLSALGAGAFFPYPESSRIWSIARYNPFAQVLLRFLTLIRTPATAPGTFEYTVWLIALGFTGIVLWKLNRRTSYTPISERIGGAWLARHQTAIVCGLGLVVLPAAIWLAGPVNFVPAELLGSVGLMYPYAGLATVLLLLLNVLLVAPLVDGSAGIVNTRLFRVWFLSKQTGTGFALLLTSTACAAAVWRTPFPTLAHTALALGLFHLWSLLLMHLVAALSRDRTVYWALTVTIALLIVFLGGSLWRPARLGQFGEIMSHVLPNGLLLHHVAFPGFLVVCFQSAMLLVAADLSVRRHGCFRHQPVLRDHRKGLPPSPITALSVHTPAPERVRGGMVDSLMLRERRRILDEVHDTLGHGITGALWQIRSAKGMTDDPSLQATLDRAADGLEQGLSRIREYLRDSAPRRSGEWSELYAAIERFSHCPVDLSLSGDPAGFHPTAVKRFTQTIQELLTNALRYGAPTSIHVHLVRTRRYHRLEYKERGRGWGSTGPRMGYGLSTVQALFTEIGGSFHLDHLPDDEGIQVIGIVPIQEAHEHERQ